MTAEKIVPLTPTDNPADEAPMSIPKPSKSTLDMFKSTRDPSIAGVETLLTALPHTKCRKLEIGCACTRMRPNIGRRNIASCTCRSKVRSATRCT